jgi:hypothetical protein
MDKEERDEVANIIHEEDDKVEFEAKEIKFTEH